MRLLDLIDDLPLQTVILVGRTARRPGLQH
jgi:hypothetical protein